MTKRDTKKPATWPTLEEQLVASKVVDGSALDTLVRENQDFHMLRPEEAHDKLLLPVWLRVYWRKHHPDAIYSGPSGGYPLVLSKLYEWMVEHQDLTPEPGQVTDKSPATVHSGKERVERGN